MIASQVLLAPNTLTLVYQVTTAQKQEIQTEVFICNQDGGQWSTLDVAVTNQRSRAPVLAQYLYKGYSLRPNETKHPRLLLRDGDSIFVQVTTNRVSVVVSAEEVVVPRTVERQSDRLDERLEMLATELQRIAALVEGSDEVPESLVQA